MTGLQLASDSRRPFTVDQYTWPAFQGRTPFNHQKVTVAFVIKHKRAMILNDMGTGKTLSALWACDILMLARKIRRVLVICPLSSMRAVWEREVKMNLTHRRVSIAHGSKQVRIAALKSQTDFVVINHDGIKVIEDEIVNEQFDLIVIDELTAFKADSDRTKCMRRIAKEVRAVWGMTGELTPNAPTEAFWPCKIVNPSNQFLPKYFGQFRDACMLQINEMVWIPKPEAPQVVAMCAQPAIRFTRDQCLDLPDTTFETLEVPMTGLQSEYYETMRKKAYIEYQSGGITAVNAAVKLNKLMQISAGAVKNDEGQIIEIGCEDRIRALIELFEATPQRKLVVFATYRATIEMLLRELQKHRIQARAIHGDVPHTLRGQYIDQFQSGPLNVLVLQPQSSAHSITLTASSTIVWFSLIPSNELYNQGNARIVRAGQTRKTVIYMFVSSSAERHVANILKNKGDVSDETMKLFADHKI